MKAFVCAAVLLVGCSKDGTSKTSEEHGSGSTTAKAKPQPKIALAAADEEVTQRVSATALVIVKADGTASVVPRPELDDRGQLDLTTLEPGATVAVADLAKTVATVQDEARKALAVAAPPPDEEAPPPEEEAPPPEDDTGEAMVLDEGKMGKKDSDRAEGQYRMKNNGLDPQLARVQAIEAARTAGVLGKLDPCEGSFDDTEIYGGLLGNEAGEMNGGFGYGTTGVGPGDGGTGWGTIGTGRYGTIGHGAGTGEGYGVGGGRGPVVSPAGLRGTSMLLRDWCGDATPLVLIDPHAPAAKLIEVLTALPRAQLAVTTDGGPHALALAIVYTFRAGTQAPADEVLELGFTVGPDGAKGAGYRGAKADETLWSWSGQIGQLGDGYHQGQAKQDLLGSDTVRIRVDAQLNAGALIQAIAKLVAGNAVIVSLGEPIDVVEPGRGGMRGRDAKVPSVRIGQPTSTADLDKATIRRYIKRNLLKIRYCYEKALLGKPGLEGTVSTQFVISGNGTVASASANGVDDEVSSCIAGVIKSIEFPKPKGGAEVPVKYPFEFHPSGG